MMEMAPISAPQPIPHPMGHSMTPVHSVTASVQAVGISQPRAASGSLRTSLFAEPPRQVGEPAAPQVAPESTRPSLFSTVTGAFRRRQHPGAVEPTAPVRAEPVVQAAARAEPPQASVRQTAGEEVGLDIPAFLRRQSS